MGVMSKYLSGGGARGCGLGVARTVYLGAVLGYMAGIALPRWRNKRKANKKKAEADLKFKKVSFDPDCVVNEFEKDEILGEDYASCDNNKPSPTVNAHFFAQLKKLLKIMLPGVWCVEVGLLSLHSIVLVSRTFLSVYVARLEGRMVKHIVRRDMGSFAWLLATWFGVAIPATFVNSLIRFVEGKLALAFRGRLVSATYDQYLSHQTYYRVSTLDSRLNNPDHCLTDDILAFSNSVAHLYSHISKPILDTALIAYSLFQLSRAQHASGSTGPVLALSMVWCTGRLLRMVSPKFGLLVSEEAARKGYLRHVHSRIIMNAEEIAFYNGQDVELAYLKKAYASLVKQSNKILKKKLWYVMLEQFLMKYGWAGSGMVIIALPILTGKRSSGLGDSGVSERTEYYTTARSLLISGSDAMERLMKAYKDLVELAGYTERVSNMLEVFEDCSVGRYKRSQVSLNNCIVDVEDGVPIARGYVMESTDGSITLDKVPIVTPNCEVVVPSLSFQVRPGQHVLICGPNGCGKSSLFRILSGLWPVYSGSLHKPPPSDMFYIPQRPYMGQGAFREEVIYPDTEAEARTKGWADRDLVALLEIVHLDHIVTREGGWNAKADWKDILSGGEKQRMGLARLFYHSPTWALLDECTSAVSQDVEGRIFQAARDRGITLLTITHRHTLARYHSHLLQFDGHGGWTFDSLNPEAVSSLGEERDRLEKQLEQLPQMQQRLTEIQMMMGEGGQEGDGDHLNSD